MSESDFKEFKENSSKDFTTIDVIKTPKIIIKTCPNYIYVNFLDKICSLYIIYNN